MNGVIALILRFSTNSIALLVTYAKVVEGRPIMSVKYCVPVPVFHFYQPTLQRGLSAIAELLVYKDYDSIVTIARRICRRLDASVH